MHPRQIALISRLAARAEGSLPSAQEVGEVPGAHYTCEEHFEREQRAVFAGQPRLVAVTSELAEPGACAAIELDGVPLLLARGEDGELRAFRNVCRHRSTPLLSTAGTCRKKALVCPYHGWTYELTGNLIHVPHVEAFAGRERARNALVRAHVAERHGLVWASPSPFELDALLEPIAEELAAAGAGTGQLFRRSEREVRGNWKLVIDAFLDAYHIRQLHKDTIYRFFIDAHAEAEPAGDHIRAATARRALRQSGGSIAELGDPRNVATPSYLIFPNVILILHPDYLSVLVAEPLARARTRCVHWMLIPAPPSTDAERTHWDKSFELIDRGVFEREDLAAVEAMQRGLESGTNLTQLFGAHENPTLWFHTSLARRMREHAERS
jgi:phenylpropionate dioxygenase-like ring-hydroxylating dioxygenase large terminal subunit